MEDQIDNTRSEINEIIVKYPDTENSKGQYAIKVRSIEQFFSENRVNEIPSYQRPYSWEEKEVSQLLNDIEESIKKNKKWFLGPLFTSSFSFDDQKVDILDGQQRLTTIVLILRCIYTIEFLNDEKIFYNQQFSTETGPETPEEKQKNCEKKFRLIQSKIKECLILEKEVKRLEKQKFSKFLTSNSSRQNLNEFIIGLDGINKENYPLREDLKFEPNQKFAPTLKTLNENISVINKRLKGIITEKDGLFKINQIAEQILYELFFIEIPLQSQSDVLDIFETINNRGKKLTLSDLIRFRTLKSCEKEEKQRVEEKWSEIFRISGLLSHKERKHKFFTSLDVFLERFINSISTGDGYTENSKRIEKFTEFYSPKLSSGVDEILHTLKAWEFIFDLSENGLRGNFPNDDRITSLISVLKIAIKYSENSQIAFIAYLRNQFPLEKVSNEKNHIGSVTYDFVELIKTIFSVSLYHRISSNNARGIFIEIAGSFNNKKGTTKLTYRNFKTNIEDSSNFPLNKFVNTNYPEGIKNLIFTKRNDQKTTAFILSIYQLLTGENIPNENQFVHNDIDHIMPEQWFKNGGWKEQNSRKQLLDSIEDLEDGDIKKALEEMNLNDDFYSDTKFANSFIQLIGNKFQILSTTNKRKSNNYWEEHKDNNQNGPAGSFLKRSFLDYPNDNFCIPTNPKPPYNYDRFHIKDITNRSKEIVQVILENFDGYVFKL